MSPQLFSTFMLTLVGEMVSGTHLDLLSKASSEFSQKLYLQVALDQENVVYSPLSIHLALTLTWYGARETTATQMEVTLGLTELGSSAHGAYHKLLVQLNSVGDVELYTGNALFLKPDFHIEPDFIREAMDNYFSVVSNLDLNAQGGPEAPINSFVSEKTRGTITEILPPGTIDYSTVLVIINTLFFNGTWATQFNKAFTQKQDFYKLNDITSEVDMMRGEMYVLLKKNEELGIDILQLPFKNTRFGLYIVLPREVDGIDKLESMLRSPINVAECFNDLRRTYVAVKIPKFKIETQFELNGPLQNLGIKNAFMPGEADFTGISPQDVYISEVLHKSVIEVQETGTVAAAATAVVINAFSSRPTVEHSFTADHPFIFFLRDNQSKQILFHGKFSG